MDMQIGLCSKVPTSLPACLCIDTAYMGNLRDTSHTASRSDYLCSVPCCGQGTERVGRPAGSGVSLLGKSRKRNT